MKNNIKVGIFHTEQQQNRLESFKALELAHQQEKELKKPVKYLLKN